MQHLFIVHVILFACVVYLIFSFQFNLPTENKLISLAQIVRMCFGLKMNISRQYFARLFLHFEPFLSSPHLTQQSSKQIGLIYSARAILK